MKNVWKKYLMVLLAFCLVIAIAACSTPDEGNGTGTTTDDVVSSTPGDDESSTPDDDESSTPKNEESSTPEETETTTPEEVHTFGPGDPDKDPGKDDIFPNA